MSVRIIAGIWRRRRLTVPDALGLRPTPDRVRETLFNWLGQDLSGLACLDLFAGSGALGFEAASRGANPVVLVDAAAPVVTALRANVGMLTAAAVEVVRADALQFAASVARRFDVIFVDPPYRQGWMPRILPQLPGLLKPGGVVYAESEATLGDVAGWGVRRQGRAGQVHYFLLQPEAVAAPEDGIPHG